MRIALVGYGRMGKAVEHAAQAEGIDVGLILDGSTNGEQGGITPDSLRDINVAIDFSRPECVVENGRLCAAAGVDLVIGTTGWYEGLDELKAEVTRAGTGLVYAPNFSVGANLFFLMVEQATELASRFLEFDPYVLEVHHKFKRDSPSGTALTLLGLVERAYPADQPVASAVLQMGYTAGEHEVGFDSRSERIVLKHIARDRDSYARGALRAARWIRGRKGCFRFRDLLKISDADAKPVA